MTERKKIFHVKGVQRKNSVRFDIPDLPYSLYLKKNGKSITFWK